MKKTSLIVMLIVLIFTLIGSVTYAWFTYVEQKSLASFEAGVLAIETEINNETFSETYEITDIAYVDFDQDVVNDVYGTFDYMASSNLIEIALDPQSPLAVHNITISEPNGQEGLLILLINEGLNLESGDPITSNYHDLIETITTGSSTPAEMRAAIDTYNASVLDDIFQTVMNTADTLFLQVVIWGDYDELSDPSNYLDLTYSLTISIDTVNARGAVYP
eukprot:Anaeramoba_ignava/a90141_120.p9 GENE.a90141_120~~a90141_120.p9  ORF type:complete len:220 (-),score=21.89 a90141_120:124-783(-)